jgi:hypothetical protein
MASQDRPETSRGFNIDAVFNDESATMSIDFISKVLKPGIRDNKDKRFANEIFFHSHCDFTSASWTLQGNHIYKTEELWLSEQHERKIWTQEQLHDTPPKYLYLESTALDNPQTGLAYMERLKEEMYELEYTVEVENKRVSSLPDGFYHSFSTAKHCYWDKQWYDYNDKNGVTISLSTDYRTDKPLEITLDFNAEIVWGLVCQDAGKEWRVVNSKYIKPSMNQEASIVIRLAEWFCQTYHNQTNRDVFIYGDPGGNSRTANTSNHNLPFFDQFCKVLIDNNFKIYRRELRSYPRHRDKYLLNNLILSEEKNNTPRIRFNQITCKVLIIALQSAKVVEGNLYEKNKKSEANLKNRELATDSTDALDYWLWAKASKFMPNQSGFKSRNFINR